MPYRNKTYVCFDADHDMRSYRLMQAWSENENMEFEFHNAHDLTTIRPWSTEDSIKASLRERMQNSKMLLVLVGTNTRYCHKYVGWEIELAMKHGLPIIVVNLNNNRYQDNTFCPAVLRGKLAMHVSFSPKIINHAMTYWPAQHADIARTRVAVEPYHYTATTYQSLGIA